jgi:hypothetical protein
MQEHTKTSEHACQKREGVGNWRYIYILLTETSPFGGIWFVLAIVVPPCVIYFPFRKKWNRLYPDWQAWTSSKKQTTFKPSDVTRDQEGNYICEIPLFSNILLDYEAKEDFSKHLKFFEIREHKFKYKYGKKRKVNEWLWYAKFYFGEKPQKGELKVTFK